MDDFEIYTLAQEVISSITGDLSNGIYADLTGNLTVSWIDRPRKFNAWAESNSPADMPPEHKIAIFYELARLIYKDAEEFCDFAGSELSNHSLKPLFNNSSYIPSLPANFTKEDCVKNIFMAALTWVYFHELAHANQEHGVIHENFGGDQARTSVIEEYAGNSMEEISDSKPPLTGRASALSHVTEFAADFEATNKCIHELFRQFVYKPHEEMLALDPESIELEDLRRDDYDPELFQSILYLFVSGLSCVFYRFHGLRSLTLHKVPVIRMEFHLPHIYEYLDLEPNRRLTKLSLDRRGLVELCLDAANSAAAFWITRKSGAQQYPAEFLLLGLRNRPSMREYFRIIVSTWDEIEPTIKNNRRFGTGLDLMNFPPDFRKHVAGM
jgi:hypothetical protein